MLPETELTYLLSRAMNQHRQISELKALIGNLESQILYLEEKAHRLHAELDALKQLR